MALFAHGLLTIIQFISPRENGRKFLLFFIAVNEMREAILLYNLAVIYILEKLVDRASESMDL